MRRLALPGTTNHRTVASLLSIKQVAVCAAAVSIGMMFGTTAACADTYTFDNLSYGTLSGQDGWTDWTTYGISSPVIANGGSYSSTDTSHVVTGIVSPTVALHALSVPATAASLSTLQLDATLGNGAGISILSLTNASGDDPFAFGINRDSSPSFFLFRRANVFAGHYNLNVPIAYGNGASDWYRLKAIVDYSAFGGDGSISMYEQDLTAGDTGFTAVAGLQNMNLGLTASNLASAQVTDMVGLSIRVDNSAMLDNISIGAALDTPEPGSAALAVATFAALGGILRRRKRQR